MRFRHIFVSLLCLLCLFNIRHIGEGSGSGQLLIELPYLASERPTTWRPKADTSLYITIKVTKPPHYSGGKLTATLSDTTNYLGECGNSLGGLHPLDLVLPQDLLHNPGWSVESTWISLSHPISPDNEGDGDIEMMRLQIDCKDYAAYSKLTFATTESSVREADPKTIKIPKDGTDTGNDGNKIADCWKGDGANPYDPNLDNEAGPPDPNTQRGDGLAVLDEYRGLYVNGTWTDTDPGEWDVFIWSESGSGASSPSNMSFHSMSSSEVDYQTGLVHDFKIVNTPPHGMVYAIRLKNNYDAFDRLNPGKRWGYMGLGPPAPGTKGEIFTERIEGGLQAGQTKPGMIAYTVTHEIGHGVHLYHCPNHTGLNCYMWAKADGSSHHVTQYHDHHLIDYDIKRPYSAPQTPLPIPANHERDYDPETGTWSLILHLGTRTVTAPRNGTPGETTNEITTNTGSTIISTNTGDSFYGCGYNAEYDYCTDTGTCTTRTNATGIGICGHRWCCCAPASSGDTTTTNTGDSSETDTSTTNITGACGHTYTSSDSYSHRSETCPTDSNGQSCTHGTYYACSPHTHSYPAPTPVLMACGLHTVLPIYSSYHQQVTIQCGHTFYKCRQHAENHLRQTCSHTNSQGQQCRYRWFRCLYPNVGSTGPSHRHYYSRRLPR